MMKKILAVTAALSMSCVMLAGCGSTEDDNSTGSKAAKSADKGATEVTAKDALTEQINKLEGIADSEEGTVTLKFVMTSPDSSAPTISMDNIAELSTAFSDADSDSDEDSTSIDFNLDLSMNSYWKGEDGGFDISLNSTPAIALCAQGDDYYINLDGFSAFIAAVNGSDETLTTDMGKGYTLADMLKGIKVSKAELESLASQATGSTSGDTDVKAKIKEFISNKELTDKLSSMAESAEYTDGGITVNDISKEDVADLVKIVKSAVGSETGIDTDSALDILDSAADDSDSSEGGAKNMKINYTLTYSDDGISQEHKFTVTSDDGNIDIVLGVKDKATALDSSWISGAKTMEEYVGMSFTEFAGGMMGIGDTSSNSDITIDDGENMLDAADVSF